MNTLLYELNLMLAAKLDNTQSEWLNAVTEKLAASQDVVNELLFHSTVVRRKFTPENELDRPKIELHGRQYAVDVALRGLLILLAVAKLTELKLDATSDEITLDTIKQYYQYGDEHEKCALLTMLPVLDTNGIALQTALKACRCNSVLEYGAIALNNPYPAQFFPQLNFNQLVLKSLFMGLDISQIIGLSQAKNAKLSNMCFAYAIEQALADRVPPASLWLAVNLAELTDENLTEKTRYLAHFSRVSPTHEAIIKAQFSVSFDKC